MRVFKVQLVLPAEIERLKPFNGYVCVAGYDRCAVTIPRQYLNARVPGFMPRVTAPLRVETAAVADSKDPAWRCYQAARDRCTNPRHVQWKDYGGKTPPVRFLYKSLGEMLDDMGPRPAMNFTIGRKGDQGNYEPGNCLWQTREEQNQSRRK